MGLGLLISCTAFSIFFLLHVSDCILQMFSCRKYGCEVRMLGVLVGMMMAACGRSGMYYSIYVGNASSVRELLWTRTLRSGNRIYHPMERDVKRE